MSAAMGSLRQRVMRSGGITAAGYAGNQLLRFGSNLILTRLLFPEAFGVMAIMQAVVVGVTMLSDVGVAQSIVRHKQGAEPAFVNTAWTIQIVKGILMAIALWVASSPVAQAYHQPLLEGMMPWAAFAALLAGFTSTKVALANRNVETLRITLINVGALSVGIVASILFAWHDPTPYALVWGNVVATIANVVAGHVFLRGPPNRLAWDRAVATSILSFGGWVMLSSAVGYMTGEGNKLVVGSVLDIRLLGLFGLASTLSVVVSQAVGSMSSQVLFGAYSEVFRKDPSRLSQAVERARRVQIVPIWCAALVLALFGPQIVRLLYDPRYADAGIVLQFLAVGTMVSVLNNSFAGVLWAMDRVGLSTVILAVQMGLQLAGIVVGHWLHGQVGALVGLAASGWLLYPFHAALYARLGVWHPRTDLPVLVSSVVAAAAACFFINWSRAVAW